MKFSKNLYVGDSIKNPQWTKWKIRTGRGQLNVYILSICQGTDQIDCFHNGLLKQKYFKRQKLMIVGIAGDYSEALIMIEQITRDVYKETKSADIKNYLLQQF